MRSTAMRGNFREYRFLLSTRVSSPGECAHRECDNSRGHSILHRLQGNLELSEHHARFAYRVSIVINVSRGDECIRSWRHDNCVIPVRSDCYHRNSGGTFRSLNAASINAITHQLRSQLLTKRIGPYIPDHPNRIAKSC